MCSDSAMTLENVHRNHELIKESQDFEQLKHETRTSGLSDDKNKLFAQCGCRRNQENELKKWKMDERLTEHCQSQTNKAPNFIEKCFILENRMKTRDVQRISNHRSIRRITLMVSKSKKH